MFAICFVLVDVEIAFDNSFDSIIIVFVLLLLFLFFFFLSKRIANMAHKNIS